MVRAMKLRWAEVNSEFQRSAHLVQLDTIGKVRRKENWESGLTSLERDIQRLEYAQTVVGTVKLICDVCSFIFAISTLILI